jgi:hypothetical protein
MIFVLNNSSASPEWDKMAIVGLGGATIIWVGGRTIKYVLRGD